MIEHISDKELFDEDGKFEGYDNCSVCQAMKAADENDRELSFDELIEVMDEANKNSDFKLPWYERFLMRYWPKMFFRIYANKNNVGDQPIDCSEGLFRNAKRIDLSISQSGSRGFIITLNNNFSLFFYQDGDTFKYDGFEIGEYENGDITVLDNK